VLSNLKSFISVLVEEQQYATITRRKQTYITMSNFTRTLGGPKFRVWAYSITLFFAIATMALAAPFMDMWDWNVGSYPYSAAVILTSSSLFILIMPVLYYYFQRKRPQSFFASRAVESFWLSAICSSLLVGAIFACVRQHQVYETDPFVPDMAIALEVLSFVTWAGTVILLVSAFCRRDEREEMRKHQRLTEERNSAEMV